MWARTGTEKYFESFIETIDKYAAPGARESAYSAWPEEVKFNLVREFENSGGDRYNKWFKDKYGTKVIGCTKDDCRRKIRYI